MRILKSHPLLSLMNSYFIDSPQPSNISYYWNGGSLLGLCLIIQIITGIFLGMRYIASDDLAFISVENIMRNVWSGYYVRYMHANVATFFFYIMYIHVGRGLYYGSFRSPRTTAWNIGVIILVLLMGTGFLGYCLPYGQMSYWGSTVIINLASAIPWIGNDIKEFVWGSYSVSGPTITRFFVLHYTLAIVVAALALVHIISLHDSGSSNPLGITGNSDRLPFHPYFSLKDLVTVVLVLLLIVIFVSYYPNVLGHSDNYIKANPMSTPLSIVPESYLLPYYAILRSIPNKTLGVIGMFSSFAILCVLPWLDLGTLKGGTFRPLYRIIIFMFWITFVCLLLLGSRHVENPYIVLGQIMTVCYFSLFLVFLPLISFIENTFIQIHFNKNIQ